MLVARTPHSLGRFRVLFTGAIALNLLHCGDTDENLQDDLQASDSSGGNDNPSTTGDAGLNISGDWGFFLFEYRNAPL